MKNIKKRDIYLVLAIAVFAVILLAAGLSARKAVPSVAPGSAIHSEELTSPAPAASEEAAPVSEDITAAADAYLERNPAESYVIVTAGDGMYPPVPLVEGNSFKLNFSDTEYNIVHIGNNSFYMEESTCDNQNCVGQGEVTLENRETRILFNMVLCLPHDLSLELVDVNEAREFLIQYYTAAFEYQAAMSAAQAQN